MTNHSPVHAGLLLVGRRPSVKRGTQKMARTPTNAFKSIESFEPGPGRGYAL